MVVDEDDEVEQAWSEEAKALRRKEMKKLRMILTFSACYNRHLICLDISGGLEPNPIPVFSETDQMPEHFEYVVTNVVQKGSREDQILNLLHEKKLVFDDNYCGLSIAKKRSFYTAQKLLAQSYDESYIFECGKNCHRTKQCNANKVLTEFLRKIRLEIFQTNNGFGVRSPERIPAGTLLCEYVGELLFQDEADYLLDDQYLFDITQVQNAYSKYLKDNDGQMIELLSKAFKNFPFKDQDFLKDGKLFGLTIDGKACGNVGRFFNHSCDPNMMVKLVVTQGCSALLQKVCFFTIKDVEAMEELTWHYNYPTEPIPGCKVQLVQCKCYSDNCSKVLRLKYL
eukprot:TRINITY_DN3845_c0_g3_i1.p1 TRINITY_DN3845_c0_g3~~TRINITY_DN3845_c0_g3_i1.p1  ORF type:complete len:340 (-),score=33.99 TRINITY_DN3845_c0_g3_i1:597-1616(-)